MPEKILERISHCNSILFYFINNPAEPGKKLAQLVAMLPVQFEQHIEDDSAAGSEKLPSLQSTGNSSDYQNRCEFIIYAPVTGVRKVSRDARSVAAASTSKNQTYKRCSASRGR